MKAHEMFRGLRYRDIRLMSQHGRDRIMKQLFEEGFILVPVGHNRQPGDERLNSGEFWEKLTEEYTHSIEDGNFLVRRSRDNVTSTRVTAGTTCPRCSGPLVFKRLADFCEACNRVVG